MGCSLFSTFRADLRGASFAFFGGSIYGSDWVSGSGDWGGVREEVLSRSVESIWKGEKEEGVMKPCTFK